MTDGMLRVGRLAELTGLTVRTLHHYDELGLVRPSRRTAAGYRLYDDTDVERLYRVIALRQLGLPLERIAEVLDDAASLESTLCTHDRLLAEQIAALQSIRARIGVSLATVRARSTPSSDLLDVIREVTSMDETMAKYFDADQMGELARRRETVGDERIAEVENRWPSLMAEVDAAMAEGVDPASPRAVALAVEWMGLLEEFHGNDPGLKESLYAVAHDNADLQADESATPMFAGPTKEQMAFVGQAWEHRG
ncbi:MerR family transcriptional regulator [Williamsia serinedens]|jgi:DNA-binding transcriptional MerR regulator|uniref:DNA-binding transcriptional regulator, MerR family n=1 Tax=Williamsia serinedens TaxID=391736 RepID=A0ABT1H6U0_9NOCA|nr:MerR family transcriptional regulator [Williamsia serinedens]MCP2161587.1 DNA-binding transcriptional regulator, MerR family [Williamsia serinedens]